MRLKEGSQKKGYRNFKEFFWKYIGKYQRKGYAIFENIENDKEIVVLTFWDTREDKEKYYSNDILSDLVEQLVANLLEWGSFHGSFIPI